jgi:hypothetical protein
MNHNETLVRLVPVIHREANLANHNETLVRASA